MAKSEKIVYAGFDVFNYLFLTLFMLICIYPFYYIFIYSLSDPREVMKGITLLPAGLTLFNYQSVFGLKDIFLSFSNSILRTVIGTAVTVFCCSLFAYVVSKDELYFKKIIYRFLVITMYINAGLIPNYLTIKAYGLRNNFLVYILPYAISAFYVVLLKTFIEQLPPSLEESAKIDGAGYFDVFIKVIFPLSRPIIATIVVFAAVNQWNTWFDNYLYCSKPQLKTLQYVLYNFLNEAQQKASSVVRSSADQLNKSKDTFTLTPEGLRMTVTMIVTFPIILVYPFMQKYFVKGIMLGAIKG